LESTGFGIWRGGAERSPDICADNGPPMHAAKKKSNNMNLKNIAAPMLREGPPARPIHFRLSPN
jgi:hypothetical protein